MSHLAAAPPAYAVPAWPMERPIGIPACVNGVLEAIGNTPLIRLSRYLDDPSIDLLVKLESANPGGSAKDRPARQMLEHARNTGRIDGDTVIIESSSGNMGIGLAQACRYHDLDFVCVVDPHAQPQNIAIMRALGARIETVTREVGGSFLGARLERVQQLQREIPNSFWPNQYANRQNAIAHDLGTIREIDRQLQGEFDYLFVATSSTGTAQGCRRFLHDHHRQTKIIAVDAVGSVLFGGIPGPRHIPGLGAGREPALARHQSFDGVFRVSDVECVVGCRRAVIREALLVGGSAGGVLEAIRTMQDELAGSRCVAILHDSGTRYLDTVFDDGWVETVLDVRPEELAHRINQPACVAS